MGSIVSRLCFFVWPILIVVWL